MTQIEEIVPRSKPRLIDLVNEVGIDVSKWGEFKGGAARAAANPKYCYEWFFEDGEKIAVTLWLRGMREKGGRIFQSFNQREIAEREKGPTKYRARDMDRALQRAFEKSLSIRAIVCDGELQSPTRKRSRVTARMLDPISWAITEYDFQTGAATLVRGVQPVGPVDGDVINPELLAFEGALRRLFVNHRHREWRLREEKIRRAKEANEGRLICEVPGCGFEFSKKYGAVGEGYAQVHHKKPLAEVSPEGASVSYDDLAIVCANCHAMIHRNGECRSLENIVKSTRP